MDKFYRPWLLLSIACASEDAAVMLQMGKVAPLAVAPLSQVRNCANGTDDVGCQRRSLVQGSVPSGGCSKAAAPKKVVYSNVYRRCYDDSCTSVMAIGGSCYRQRMHLWKCQGKWYKDRDQWFLWPRTMGLGHGCKYIAPKPFNTLHPLWQASLPNQGWCNSAEDKSGGYCRAPKGIFETPDDCFNYRRYGSWQRETEAVQFRGGGCDFYRRKGEAPNDCPEGFHAGRGTDTNKLYKKVQIGNPSWAVFCKIFR